LRAGKLSRVQANEVTAAAVVDPASETRLLQKAQRGTFKDLKEFSARVKAAVRDDNTEHLRIRAIRKRQHLARRGRRPPASPVHAGRHRHGPLGNAAVPASDLRRRPSG
jgi:hypothetical protein